VCLLRDGVAGPEVLMVQRGRSARFMGGAWVFPGGAVDDVDGSAISRRTIAGAGDDLPWLAAALRELVEEVAIWVTDGPSADGGDRLFGRAVFEALEASGRGFDARAMAYFAHWVTPTMIPVRFDTRFYAMEVGAGVEPDPDPGELAAASWVDTARALERGQSGEWTVPFPTLKVLEMLDGFDSAGAVIAHAAGTEVRPILPRTRVAAGGEIEIVLPGEPGYDELGDAEEDPEALDKAVSAGGAHHPELGGGRS
jgi:8-oxo-dGTP pyrophosphatase MutT (NUDIX family)